MNIKKYTEHLVSRVADLAKARKLKGFAEENGFSYSWLSKFGQGKVGNPTIKALESLNEKLPD